MAEIPFFKQIPKKLTQCDISVFISVDQTAFCNDSGGDLGNIIAFDIQKKLKKYQAKAFLFIYSSGLVADFCAVFQIIIDHYCKSRRNIGCFHSTMTSVRDTIHMIVKPSDYQKNCSVPVIIARIISETKVFPKAGEYSLINDLP